MLSVLAATMFLLGFFVLPGPISRLVGAKFVAMFFATTGVFVIPVILGPTWRGALAAGFDVSLLLVGAKLASRLGFAREICTVWITRLIAVISAALCVFFIGLALMVAGLAGHTADTLPYDFLALVSGIVCAVLLSRRQKQVLTFNLAGSLISASPQA